MIVANPTRSKMIEMTFVNVLRPHLVIFPLPRFYHTMREGSGALSTLGHLPAIYLCSISPCLFLHLSFIRSQALTFMAFMNFFLPFILWNWM